MTNLSKLIKVYMPIWCILSVNIVFAQVPAFPGAEGFGANAIGGRGGDVIAVTNLNDSGVGSLRDGVETNGPRIIVFKVSGTIELESDLEIKYPYCTIAGQTAPGDGITLKNWHLNVNADQVIVRYIRSRLGDLGSEDQDAITVTGGSNIVIDHCSASWSIDETLSNQSDEVDSITVQWCTVTESLNNSHHEKGAHGYGGIIGAWNQTFHHNLYAHHTARNPKVTWRRPLLVDFRNNVIYNWGWLHSCHDGADAYMNWVANYYKYGPATSISIRDRIFRLYDDWGDVQCRESKLYADRNFVWGYPDITADNWNGGIDFAYGATEEENRAYIPFACPPINEHTAEEAYVLVLEHAGASLARDPIDTRIVTEVENGISTYGTNGIIDSQVDVGSWTTLYSLPAPMDSDNDGMPDYWEEQYGLNIDDSTDNIDDSDGDGYENIEEYINNTDPSGGNLAIVYIRASDSRANEKDGEPGEFTVYRTGNTDTPLSIGYTVSGTATAGDDYSALSGTVTIEANQASAKITIIPFQDAKDENTELVVLTLNAGENKYHVGCPNASLLAINQSPSSVAIEKNGNELIPEYFELKYNFPNPFNLSTQINFYLLNDQHVSLKIYDIKGRFITTLIESYLKEGNHHIIWNGTDIIGNDVPSGIYMSVLKTKMEQQVIKMVLIK